MSITNIINDPEVMRLYACIECYNIDTRKTFQHQYVYLICIKVIHIKTEEILKQYYITKHEYQFYEHHKDIYDKYGVLKKFSFRNKSPLGKDIYLL